MTIKIGINGFGRIGRNVLRSAVQNFSDIEVVGIDRYGESAPAPVLFKHFGFTVENVVATVKAALNPR
jgi:glyceraldehyde-3-phosphate dehydrogenase/erythrose-4-phosphate dehydrogenase